MANGVVLKPGDRVPMKPLGSLWYVLKVSPEGRWLMVGPPGNCDSWQFNDEGRFITTLHNHPWPAIDLTAILGDGGAT